MTGARLAGTAAMQINSTDAQLALCTLCVGVGVGVGQWSSSCIVETWQDA